MLKIIKSLEFSHILIFFLMMIIYKNFTYLDSDIYLLFNNTIDMFEKDAILYKDILEINFPFIFIFNLIPYFLYDIFSIDMAITYTLELILVSYFIHKLLFSFLDRNNIYLSYNLYLFPYLLFFFFNFDSLQRDWIVFLTFFPYIIFLFVKEDLKLDIKNIDFYNNLFIALSIIGIYIKPQYALIIVLIHLYLFFIHKSFKYYLLDYVKYILFGIIYIISLYFITPYFFINTLPNMSDYLNGEFGAEYIYNNIYSIFIFLINVFLFSILDIKKNRVLIVSLIGFWFVIFVQKQYFHYHFVPVGLFTLLMLFISIQNSSEKIRHNKIIIAFFIFLLEGYILVKTTIYDDFFNVIEKISYTDMNKSTVVIDDLWIKSRFIYKYDIDDFISSGSTSVITLCNDTSTNLYKNQTSELLNDLKHNKREYVLIRNYADGKVPYIKENYYKIDDIHYSEDNFNFNYIKYRLKKSSVDIKSSI
jgi:hypothetical protein